MKIQIPRYKGFKVGIFRISPIDDYEENRFFNFEFSHKVVNFIHMFQHRFFIFCFTDFFRNKLVSEDELKIKIKFIQTIFQLN